MTASTSGELPDELQTCAGISWVKFGQGIRRSANISVDVPMVRCLGLPSSQPISAGPMSTSGSRTASGSGDSAQAAVAGNAAKAKEASVEMFCAGRLSMIIRAAATAAAASQPSSHAALGPPFDIRCNGLSLRVERPLSTTAAQPQHSATPAPAPEPVASTAGATSAAVAAASEAPYEGPRPGGVVRRLAAAAIAGATAANAPEFRESMSRRVETLGSRFSGGAAALGQVARDIEGPVEFVRRTTGMSGRISTKALLICRRSVELLGRWSMMPLRQGEDDSDAVAGSDGSKTSGKGTRPGPGGG